MKNLKSKTKFCSLQAEQLNIEQLQIIINHTKEKEKNKIMSLVRSRILKWISRYLQK